MFELFGGKVVYVSDSHISSLFSSFSLTRLCARISEERSTPPEPIITHHVASIPSFVRIDSPLNSIRIYLTSSPSIVVVDGRGIPSS